jgi:hypothetical protein
MWSLCCGLEPPGDTMQRCHLVAIVQNTEGRSPKYISRTWENWRQDRGTHDKEPKQMLQLIKS